jgi:hypothetical protein
MIVTQPITTGSSAWSTHPDLSSIMLNALERLATTDGLNSREIALRCLLTGRIPTCPAFSHEVIACYQKLEHALTRGEVKT